MKLGSLIWMGIKGYSLSDQEKKDIQQEEVSGLILFKRNIQSLPQLFELCQEIQSLKPAPLIMMDREGGSVDRLRSLLEYPSWPAPAKLAELCSLREIEQTAFYQAQEIKALGVSVSFAPALDLPSVFNPLFKGRLWGKTPQQIAKRTIAYMRGFKSAGLATSAKHFPGHGGVREDSHFSLPVDQREFKNLKDLDLFPFQKAIDFDVEIIMTAHVLYSKVDVFPATLSEFFLKKVLREEMKFKNLIVSDDLDMGALQGENSRLEEVMAKALLAGVDVLLKCKPSENFKELLEKVREVLDLKARDFFEKTRRALKSEEKQEEIYFWKKQQKALIEEKLFRIKKFKQKYGNIKPLGSFKALKKSVKDPKVHRWCEKLQKRVQEI